MKSILRIARTELGCLFFSPIAWLLLIVFILQTSMRYVGVTATPISQEYNGNAGWAKLTEFIFASDRFGLFDTVANNLYYFVPLLTMGVIARELHSGSIKLLLSSPVNLTEIILGKYLAVVAYFMLFILVLLGLVVTTGASIPNFDYAMALSGVLGILLLVAAYSAIGLFMSSLTTHQVVAAISTFAVLFVLDFIGTIGQRVPFLSELAYWLSISGRVDYMRFGLIASKDVLYFLAIVVLFLTFTYLRLSAGRRIERGVTRASKYAAVLLGVATFGYFTSLPATTVYLDTTREKSQTLAHGSQNVMQDVSGPWKVTVYANVLSGGSRFLPRNRNRLERQLFEQYWRKNPDLEVDYVLYYGPSESQRIYENNPGKSDEDLARDFAYQQRLDFDDFLSSEAVSEHVDVHTEQYRNFYVVEWNDGSTVVRNFRDIQYYPSEREITTGLKRLVEGSNVVGYVTGHGERSAFRRGDADHQYIATARTLRGGMLNQGFDVEEISLNRSVPDRIDLIVIAAPTEPYSPRELRNLQAYIDGGGNMLIAGEPGDHAVLNPIVESLGVEFRDGRVVEPKQDYPETFIFGRLSQEADTYGFDVHEFDEDLPYLFNGAVALRYDTTGPFEATPILLADGADAFLQTAAPTEFDETALALAMRREVGGREQRLIVAADADFMSTAELTRRSIKTNNFDFLMDVLAWLTNDTYPVDTSRPPFIDRHITIRPDQIDYLKLVLYGLVPILLTLWGGGLLMRRQRN